jgi:FkbM family methyltransferase
MIQRVFARIEKGNYIDVGASVPIPDSNTYALYQKGWRGVCIEPLPLYNDQWKQQRPKDILINAAVSDKEGKGTLFIYEGAQQVSTCLPGIKDHWQANANLKPDRAIEVQHTTLDKVIADHLSGQPIHLLSIDAEGMEASVLSGIDLTTHRPWLMVIEATLPGTPFPSHQQWEPILLNAGYLMVYFDGVNRFYLANEQRNLIGAFATPPNSWDNIEMK